MTDDAELRRTADLLNSVFEHADPLTIGSLRWYYDDNPVGGAAVGRIEDDGRRLGNYALIPQKFVAPDGETRILGLGVDLAVDPIARGSGTFRRTVEDSYARGVEQGFDGILGVANANSAPRMVASLGWRALEPLPVTLVPAIGRARGFVSTDIDDSTISALEGLGGSVFPRASSSGFAPVWTPEYLRWRLSRPGHDYSVHVSDDLVVISLRTHVARVPVGVILKVLPRVEGVRTRIGRLAAVVGRHHRAPFVIHWGRNPTMEVRGIPLPQSKMPSPLSLVLHPFSEDFDRERFELGEFEFLDFDAY